MTVLKLTDFDAELVRAAKNAARRLSRRKDKLAGPSERLIADLAGFPSDYWEAVRADK